MLPFLGKIGSILIPTMPVFWCLGYLAGTASFIILASRAGLHMGRVLNFLALTIVASAIGARVSAVLLLSRPEGLHWFFEHPGEIFKFWKSGFSLYGVLFFGSLTGLWYTLRNSLPVWRTADIAVPGMGLGHAIQSFGDFLAGAHPGWSTGLPWGISIHHWNFRGLKGVPLHPVMLYIAALALFGYLSAWAWLQARDHPGEKFFLSWLYYPVIRILKLKLFDGELFFVGGAFYATFRFFIEFFRDPRTLIWYPDFPLPQTQVACICFFLVCLGWYLALRAIGETEQKGLPDRLWMKLCFRLAAGLRWLAQNVPWPVTGDRKPETRNRLEGRENGNN